MRQILRVNSSCSYEVCAVQILDGFQIVLGGNLIVDAMVNLKRLIPIVSLENGSSGHETWPSEGAYPRG
jgi:hypothetical protein